MPIRNEIKNMLRDWLTATTQMEKVRDNTLSVSDIAFMWRAKYGIKMNDKWVTKALYPKGKGRRW